MLNTPQTYKGFCAQGFVEDDNVDTPGRGKSCEGKTAVMTEHFSHMK